MGLEEVFTLKRKISDKVDVLCKQPTANSQEQVNEWLDNNITFLRAKAKNVKSMSSEIENDIDILFQECQTTYYGFVEDWYEYGYRDFEGAKLLQILRNNNISDVAKKEIRNNYKKLQTINIDNVSQNDKINYFFDVFENIIDSINKGQNWFDLYKGSRLRGDDLVFDISYLDLFAWQLPNIDLRNKNDYKKIAKIMTIFFFIEKIYKKEYSLSNDINPFDKIMNLDKIVSYYYFSKEI